MLGHGAAGHGAVGHGATDQGATQAQTYYRGGWLEGNPKVIGPMTHGFWMSSVVFDGARAFDGVAPDLDRHCARCIASAAVMGLAPMLTAGEIEEIARDGIARFPRGAELYIRPAFFAEGGFVLADAETTEFVLTIHELPLPGERGFSACLSSRQRPSPAVAPTQAKASCLYPNVGLALREARARGFDTAVMLDPLGHVAEFATANLFLAKDGVVATPALNGTFLNGITRQRVIELLRDDGIEVRETVVTPEDLFEADELFSTGNLAKVQPATRFEGHHYQAGPVYQRARALYWAFAHQ